MNQIVIDTNVFVAAGFNNRSASARILAAVRAGRFQLVWNKPTRRETEAILQEFRASIGRTLQISSGQRENLLAPSILTPSP